MKENQIAVIRTLKSITQ